MLRSHEIQSQVTDNLPELYSTQDIQNWMWLFYCTREPSINRKSREDIKNIWTIGFLELCLILYMEHKSTLRFGLLTSLSNSSTELPISAPTQLKIVPLDIFLYSNSRSWPHHLTSPPISPEYKSTLATSHF